MEDKELIQKILSDGNISLVQVSFNILYTKDNEVCIGCDIIW